MKVKELKELLNNFDDEDIVVTPRFERYGIVYYVGYTEAEEFKGNYYYPDNKENTIKLVLIQ